MTQKASRKHHSHHHSADEASHDGRRASGDDIRQIFGIIAAVVVVLGIAAVILFPQLRGNRTADSKQIEAAKPGGIVVLAAASLTQPLEKAVKWFEASDSTTTVQLSCASSNFLRRQIERGAPADLFISASKEHVLALKERAWIETKNIVPLWTTQLVVIAPETTEDTFASVKDALATARRLAIGDLGVPVGEYARQTLKTLELQDALEKQLVPMIDETAVINAVASRSCDRGIAYAAGISSPQWKNRVKVLAKIPSSDHEDIIYLAAILNDSKNKDATRRFLDFLTTGEGGSILEQAGFLPAPPDSITP